MYAAIDTDTIGNFAVATYYDEYAENPQHNWDHAAVFVPFRRASWQHLALADVVPTTYRAPDAGANTRSTDLTGFDPDAYVNNYDDPDDDTTFTGFADWCADLAAAFGADVHVAFVTLDNYGSNGGRVYCDTDPLPPVDCKAYWEQIVDGTERADGCIVVSARTAPGTDVDAYAAIVRGDCAELNAYLSGECYYWSVTDLTTGEDVETIGGYVGYYAEMLAEARTTAAWYADERDRTLAWLRAEAEWRLTVPDVATVLAAHRTLDQLDELADYEPA